MGIYGAKPRLIKRVQRKFPSVNLLIDENRFFGCEFPMEVD